MGRKKKKQSKPWCWYCNREFDDEKILIQHQKAKHFKCHICHKKLFTGPGLSIHCMQVHKEAIDKVPNSLSNRSNIDIEIYGMEGIPPEDLKEHERQKLGKMGRAASPSSGEDEPPTKKKADGPSGLTPGLGLMGGARPSLSQPPGMPPGALPPGYPMMSMGHMPPFMPPGFSRMGMMPGSSMQPSVPSPHLQNKPLFPSAAAIASSSGPSTINDTKTTSTTAGTVKPTFPAYSASGVASGSSSSSDSQKVSLITTVGGSSKIIHPPEDISLEEFKAKLPKYQTNSPVGNSTSAAVAGVGTTDEAQSSPSPSVATSSNTSQAGQPQQLQQPPIDTKPMERRIPPPVNRMPVMSVSAPGMLPPASASMIMSMAGPHGLMRGPPTIPLIPASMPLLRHQIPMHPGLIGGMVPPPGAVYGGGAPLGAFPGPPLMLPPRFR